jgi:hypothetical protein
MNVDVRFCSVDSKHFTTKDQCSDRPMLVILAHFWFTRRTANTEKNQIAGAFEPNPLIQSIAACRSRNVSTTIPRLEATRATNPSTVGGLPMTAVLSVGDRFKQYSAPCFPSS